MKNDDLLALPISNLCGCNISLTHIDIIELSIKPTIKAYVSAIIGTITNYGMFGMYVIDALFVTFDSFMGETFHSSYQQLLQFTLEKTVKSNMKAKRLGIPFFVFQDIFVNRRGLIPSQSKKYIFVSLFSKGSLVQVSSATYQAQISIMNGDMYGRECFETDEIYWETPKLPGKRSINSKNIVSILLKGDILPSEGIQNTFYVKRTDTSIAADHIVTVSKL
jgi:hypothetical protein